MDENKWEDFTRYNITKNNIEAITDHYKTLIKKRNIPEKLIKIFDNRVSEIKGIQGEEVFMAETFALLINDIVYNFDMQFLSGEESREIKEMDTRKSYIYFQQTSPTDDVTLASLFDNDKMNVNSVALEKYNRWIEFLRISLLINSGFITYDEAENDALKDLLAQYTDLKIDN